MPLLALSISFLSNSPPSLFFDQSFEDDSVDLDLRWSVLNEACRKQRAKIVEELYKLGEIDMEEYLDQIKKQAVAGEAELRKELDETSFKMKKEARNSKERLESSEEKEKVLSSEFISSMVKEIEDMSKCIFGGAFLSPTSEASRAKRKADALSLMSSNRKSASLVLEPIKETLHEDC